MGRDWARAEKLHDNNTGLHGNAVRLPMSQRPESSTRKVITNQASVLAYESRSEADGIEAQNFRDQEIYNIHPIHILDLCYTSCHHVYWTLLNLEFVHIRRLL